MKWDWIQQLNKLIILAQSQLSKKQFILFSAILVGLSAGLAAIILKSFVHLIFTLATYKPMVSLKYLYLILPVLGIFLTVWAKKKILKGKLEKGLPPIHYAIAKKSSIIPREQMYAQVLTSGLTVGLGGSAGLEAPIVVTGAAFGSNYAKTYRLDYKERTLLLACGVAAGIGTAFNAPIAGVLFALEVLLLDISISAFTPLIIAAATGALISKVFLKDEILFSFPQSSLFNYINVPFYVLLGILTGLLAVYHQRVFLKLEHWLAGLNIGAYKKVFLAGAMLAILILFFPGLFGEGYTSIKLLASTNTEKLFENSILKDFTTNKWIVLMLITITMLLKVFATSITLGSGGNGGNFAPSLFVGAYAGFVFSRFINLSSLTTLPESNFTLVGMAGILSGLYHAPLTALFLIAEITGGYNLLIPLMIVSSISYAISKHFEKFSMDAKKLASSGLMFTSDKDKNILTTISTSRLVESDFIKVFPTQTLGEFVKIISSSKRNIFPVVNLQNKLLGIIVLDNVREVIFKHDLYEKVLVKELMSMPPEIVAPFEPMESVMKKFDETGAWNLPVINNGEYVGFISKSSIFSNYRNKLIDYSIE
ncbi:MAG TPA: chloride channel protein [Bacteroidia bacterium]|nr:chloride channel protein [Bacteroidia bacterium]